MKNFTFDEFIDEKNEEISQIVSQIQTFKIDFKPINPINAKNRVIDWLRNFDNLGYRDFELPLALLKNITYLTTERITNEIQHLVSDKLTEAYLVPLGEKSESSFRITSSFNRNPRMYLSLAELLDSLTNDEKPEIIFLDDFLNSGGQIVSIFYSLLGEKLPEGEIADEIDLRMQLTGSQIKKLKKCKITLYYYLAFEEGKGKIDKLIKERLNLNIKVENIQITNKYDNAFGSDTMQESIKLNLDGLLDDSSIFRNIEFKRLNPFYKLIEKVGLELLKKNNPHWNEEKLKNKEFGYGNLGRLIITDQNVPTITITSLWLNGKITVDGIELEWKELLPRTKKELSRRVSNNSDNVEAKIQEIQEIGEQLEQLYIADQFSVGLAKAEYFYKLYPEDIKILKYLLKYNIRDRNSSRIKEIIKNFPEKNSNSFLKMGYFSLFETQLREANDFKDEKETYIRKLNEARISLNKVPQEFQDTSRFLYLLGRYHLEMGWINRKTDSHTEYSKAVTYFIKSTNKIYYWWTHCYLCITLKLLGKTEDFDIQREMFYSKIKEEYYKEKERHILWLYYITAILMKEDVQNLKEALEEVNEKEVEPNDFEETLIHRVELLFSTESNTDKQEFYKDIIKKYLLLIKRK